MVKKTEVPKQITIQFEASDFKEQQLDGTEQKSYVAAIFAIFPRLEKDIRREMYTQLVAGYTEADNWDKILKTQGMLEGMAILLDKWEKARDEHISNSKPEEDFDRSNPISEV